jgi:hypothetical protein
MEFASLFFAGISAAMAAIQVWQASRNKDAAVQKFDQTFQDTLKDPETQAAAQQLLNVAPADVVRDLVGRAEKCWTSYRKVLGGPFLPDEIDNATDSVRACVCRELGRIHKINGGKIPHRWRNQWDAYDCVGIGKNQKSIGA